MFGDTCGVLVVVLNLLQSLLSRCLDTGKLVLCSVKFLAVSGCVKLRWFSRQGNIKSNDSTSV